MAVPMPEKPAPTMTVSKSVTGFIYQYSSRPRALTSVGDDVQSVLRPQRQRCFEFYRIGGAHVECGLHRHLDVLPRVQTLARSPARRVPAHRLRRRPPAVSLGVDLALAGLPHAAGVDEPLHPFRIGFRPPTARLSRAEPLNTGHLVVGPRQAVDPPEAKGDLHRLAVRHARLGCVLVQQPQPDLAGPVVIVLQPLFPLLRCARVEHLLLGHPRCSAAFSAARPRLVASAAAGTTSAKLTKPCTSVGALYSSTGTPAAESNSA